MLGLLVVPRLGPLPKLLGLYALQPVEAATSDEEHRNVDFAELG